MSMEFQTWWNVNGGRMIEYNKTADPFHFGYFVWSESVLHNTNEKIPENMKEAKLQDVLEIVRGEMSRDCWHEWQRERVAEEIQERDEINLKLTEEIAQLKTDLSETNMIMLTAIEGIRKRYAE